MQGASSKKAEEAEGLWLLLGLALAPHRFLPDIPAMASALGICKVK